MNTEHRELKSTFYKIVKNTLWNEFKTNKRDDRSVGMESMAMLKKTLKGKETAQNLLVGETDDEKGSCKEGSKGKGLVEYEKRSLGHWELLQKEFGMTKLQVQFRIKEIYEASLSKPS